MKEPPNTLLLKISIKDRKIFLIEALKIFGVLFLVIGSLTLLLYKIHELSQ